MNITRLFSALTRWSAYLLFFLTPIFLLPWTSNVLEVNKQMLLVLLTAVALMSWLGSMVVQKRLTFKTGWLNLPPALFLLFALVSSIGSLAGYQTWVGQASQEYTSFLTTAVLVFLFYVLMNVRDELPVAGGSMVALFSSAAIAGLLGLLSLGGWFQLPFAFAGTAGFNTVGTVNGFAAFLCAVMFMGIAAWLVSGTRPGVLPEGGAGMATRALIAFDVVIALIVMVAVDVSSLWIVSAIGVLALAAFGFFRAAAFPDPRRFSLPLFVLFVSVLLFFFRTPLSLNAPAVVSPSYSASWGIAKAVLSEGWPRLVAGSGPGTFAFDYALSRPNAVNGTIFWNTHFDRAKSHVLTLLATFGSAGALLWLATMLAVGTSALARLLRQKDAASWQTTFVLFSGWLALFVTHLLSSSNVTLSFLLWGVSGLLAAECARSTVETDFGRSPRLGLASSFAFVLVAVAVLATLFVNGGRYAAEMAFAKAVAQDAAGIDAGEVIASVSRAVTLNPLSDVYQRNLASAYLSRARATIASASGKELSADERAAVSQDIAAAVNASKRATELEPNNASNWSVRAMVYRDVMPFVTNAEDFAAATVQQAIALEPGNPAHLVDLGRIQLAVAERATQLKGADNAELAAAAATSESDNLAAAEQSFLAAVELKPDYAVAHYYLAATYEREGRMEDATTRLEALRATAPNDVGLGFQLAMLYVRTENYDAARVELERIVQIQPNYSNALWYLASLYEINGERAKALAAVEAVSKLNPGNADVSARLAKLRAGETTVQMPGPVEEPSSVSTVEGEVQETAPADGEGVVDAEGNIP